MEAKEAREVKSMVSEPEPFAQELVTWLERGRIPEKYYGKITVPIENGRVETVLVESKNRPRRSNPVSS